MSRITEFRVEGMSCSHCVRAVEEAAKSVEGVAQVDVFLDAGSARIAHSDSTSLELIASAITAEGYHAEPANP